MHLKAHKEMQQGCFLLHFSLATSMTNWTHIFTDLLFYAWCWETPSENTGLWQYYQNVSIVPLNRRDESCLHRAQARARCGDFQHSSFRVANHRVVITAAIWAGPPKLSSRVRRLPKSASIVCANRTLFWIRGQSPCYCVAHFGEYLNQPTCFGVDCSGLVTILYF